MKRGYCLCRCLRILLRQPKKNWWPVHYNGDAQHSQKHKLGIRGDAFGAEWTREIGYKNLSQPRFISIIQETRGATLDTVRLPGSIMCAVVNRCVSICAAAADEQLRQVVVFQSREVRFRQSRRSAAVLCVQVSRVCVCVFMCDGTTMVAMWKMSRFRGAGSRIVESCARRLLTRCPHNGSRCWCGGALSYIRVYPHSSAFVCNDSNTWARDQDMTAQRLIGMCRLGGKWVVRCTKFLIYTVASPNTHRERKRRVAFGLPACDVYFMCESLVFCYLRRSREFSCFCAAKFYGQPDKGNHIIYVSEMCGLCGQQRKRPQTHWLEARCVLHTARVSSDFNGSTSLLRRRSSSTRTCIYSVCFVLKFLLRPSMVFL